MPARITVESFCSLNGEYWTNRYFTTDAYTAAGSTIDALVAAHRAALTADSIITKVRVDDNVEDTNNYDTVAFNLPGLLTAKGALLVPLFVVVRVDFDVAGGGSPSRKYMRGLLGEASMSFTAISGDDLTNANAFGNAVVAIGTICDPQGNLFVDAAVWPYPQMRQLRRASKRKTTQSTPTPV